MRVFCVFVSLLAVTRCLAATYYVSMDGLDVAPYDTWERAATSPATILAYIQSSGDSGSTIHVGAGVWEWASQMVFNHVNHSVTTVIGAGRNSTVISPGDHAVWGSVADDVVVRDLTLVANATYCAVCTKNDCERWTFIDVDFVSGVAHTKQLIDLGGQETRFKGCRFFHGSSHISDYLAYLSRDSTAVFDYCVFAPAVHDYCIGSIMCAGTQADFINCTAVGFGGAGLIAHAGVTNVVNSIVAGNGIRNNIVPAVRQGALGTLNVYNSLLMGNTWDGRANPTGGSISADLNNVKGSVYPRFRKHARQGYILPCVDDSSSFRYAQGLAGLLAEYNMQGTYFLSQCSWNSDNTAALRAMVADGVMEVGCHSYSHSPLLCTGALAISYAGSDTDPTVEFTSAGVLRLRTAQGTDDRDIDTADPRRNTIGGIVALSGINNWVIAKAATEGLYVRDACLASSMATQPRIGTPAVIPLDVSGCDAGFLKDEITNPRIWMTRVLVNGNGDVLDGQTGLVYVCRTFAPAFGPQTAASRQACMDAGYLISRGRPPGGFGLSAPKYGIALVDADLYSMRFFWAYGYLDGSETQVRAGARALAFGVVESGLAVPVLAHGASEMTLDQWRWCLDEWSAFGDDLIVTSHQLFAEVVHDPAGPWVARGDGTYCRAYGQHTDYGLLPDSPCVGAGLDMGRDHALDLAGVDQDVWGAWDVGAYVHQREMSFLIW